jgi:hypothetical protein
MLNEMLKGISPAIIGGEVDWGKDVGAENYG